MPTSNCPICDENVYVDAKMVQGDIVFCEECNSDLELVGLDPIELDVSQEDFDFDFGEEVEEEDDELAY
jgi:alpha-aminoadipate carrier protein LysW